MSLSIDIALLLILCGFIISGIVFGFVRTVGNLIGMIFGLIVASKFLEYVEQYADIPGHTILSVTIFIALAAMVSYWIGWIISFAESLLNGRIFFLPFFHAMNRWLGAIVGFAEGVLVVAAILFYSERFLTPGPLHDQIASAKMHMALGWLEGVFTKIFL